MGFKADASFLRFLSMGAVGVHRTMARLRGRGFKPIELERYCGSNKIWTTKVKRLRLPDLLCVKTGMRVEVRAKTDLKIRMSDAPANPDRAWDAGLRDDDIVALITCFDTDDGPEPAADANYFTVGALRASVDRSRLGPPKSPSEGAERDRTWSATVPTRDGTVLEITNERLIVRMNADTERPARRQTYTLRGKSVYVSPGDTFSAQTTILAGQPPEIADLSVYLPCRYAPLDDLRSDSDVDRYAAVKALRFRDDLRDRATLSANIVETPATLGMRGRQRGTRMKADRNVNSGVYPLATPALGGAPPRAETPPARRAPDPEVLAKPTRRRFSAEYRLRIVEEADRCREPGEIGRLLRREGLYSSHLSTWRKARRQGALQGLTPRKRGPKPAPSHPLGAQVRRLEAQVARLEKELATAHTILEVQGKVAGLLGFSLRDGKDC